MCRRNGQKMGVTRRHFSLVTSFLKQRGGATLGKGKNQMPRWERARTRCYGRERQACGFQQSLHGELYP